MPPLIIIAPEDFDGVLAFTDQLESLIAAGARLPFGSDDDAIVYEYKGHGINPTLTLGHLRAFAKAVRTSTTLDDYEYEQAAGEDL